MKEICLFAVNDIAGEIIDLQEMWNMDMTSNCYANARPGLDCPTIEQLVDYASDRKMVERDAIDFHLTGCRECRIVIQRVRASHLQWLNLLENNPARAIEKAIFKT